MSPRSTGISSSGDAASRPAGRRLVVSFHDLHPGSRAECAHFLERLGEFGIDRVSLLVVPRWHGAEPFTRDAEFTAWLGEQAAAGHEICLHGYVHRAPHVHGGVFERIVGRHYTQSEGEFFQIDRDEAFDRLQRGLAMLVADAGLPVYGFTPPAWLMSAGGRDAAAAVGLHYTTTWSSIELLQRGVTWRAPTLVFSCRNAWRRALSRVWVRVWFHLNRRTPLLRIAAHPGDFRDPRVEASLLRLVRDALADGRTALTYRDLLPSGAEPLPAPVIAAA